MFAQTLRHFFPLWNTWLDQLPDHRDQDAITYPRRFLACWGILLYVLQLGSRRQLDFQLRAEGTQVLANLNRLLDTEVTTRPVHDTLDYFAGRTTVAGAERLRTLLNQRLLRMKVFEPTRVLGHVPLITDGTGHLAFGQRHCDRCLRQRHGNKTYYLHQVLEAKFVGPAGLVSSAGSAFIENEPGWEKLPAEERKQQCELKAMDTLAPALKRAYPQLKICWLGDALWACGRAFALAQANHWTFVFTFKEGRLPALWQEFQTLLKLLPRQVVRVELPDGTQQEYRWVNQLDYEDSQQRHWKLNALQCRETRPDHKPKLFAWVTWLPLNQQTVVEVATQGGRPRWMIENEGFNWQKNSGMRLEHIYSLDPEKLKVYYLWLQIAHLLFLLLAKGSLLRRLVAQWGQTVLEWFGSWRNLGQRLLESLRQGSWSVESFVPPAGQAPPEVLDSS
ncbi:MAG: hypothetical protein JO112_13965 [Planctomycetes bacterium]|nr:hypothetical protein [Planctomycetota bacterium]